MMMLPLKIDPDIQDVVNVDKLVKENGTPPLKMLEYEPPSCPPPPANQPLMQYVRFVDNKKEILQSVFICDPRINAHECVSVSGHGHISTMVTRKAGRGAQRLRVFRLFGW